MSSSDEFQVGFHDNWWDTSRSDRFVRAGAVPAASITSTFGWTPTADTVKSRSSAAAAPGGSHHLQAQAWNGATALSDGGATNPSNIQMMESAAAMSWDRTRLFRSMIQEDLNSDATCNFLQESDPSESCEQNWNHKLYSEKPPSNSSTGDCSNHLAAFHDQMDSAAAAAYGLLMSEIQPHNSSAYENMVMDYPYQSSGTHATSSHNAAGSGENTMIASSWNNKFPHFLRPSPPPPATTSAGIHFNTPWSPCASMNESPSSFLRGTQIHGASSSSFDEKTKLAKPVEAAAREPGGTAKKIKNSTETSNKRSRGNETPNSHLPCFKVRKENGREKIAALQQLVSPFGKTDMASVLYEAFECIKSLQEQVRVLVSPYMTKAGVIRQDPMQINSNIIDRERDLRNRGLCLVPTSSTFALTNEMSVDFWTSRFGGINFR